MALAVAGPPVVAALVAAALDLGPLPTLVVVALGAAVSVALCVRVLLRPIARRISTARMESLDVAERSAELRRAIEVRDRFDRAAMAADSEPLLLRQAARAATELVPDHDVTLLLALPDEPRIAWSVRAVDGELVPAQPVAGRPGCTALATASTTRSESTTELDACEHLQDPPSGDVSALCVPLSLGDRSLGVLCVTGPPGGAPTADEVAAIEHVVTTTGRRLAELRNRRGPSTPGPTDPVTGLPTDVALRSRAAELVRSHVQFCAAVLRVDGAEEFRRVNGEDAWNDALRLVGDITGTTLRPDDVVCRLDSDRIAAVLANCTTLQAAAALERVRESLVLALTVAGIAHFTCSAGLVDGARGTSIDDTVRLADAAVEAALLQGGNRVVVADASFA